MRTGPRPLPLHLGLSMATSMSGIAAFPSVRSGLLPWAPPLASRAVELTRTQSEHDEAALNQAVVQEGLRRVETMLAGIEAYRGHPWRRPETDRPIPWKAGAARLIDYGGSGRPLLFVPSLINRFYVLDLLPGGSLLEWLAGQDLHPYVLDWGAPGPEERDFDVADYVARRLAPALDAVREDAGARPLLVGYCMGGLLTLAQACRQPDAIDGLALLACPWDFHAGDNGGEALRLLRQALETLLAMHGELPVDLLQMLFAALDPHLARRKFARFASLRPDGEAARRFVALEDWLNDGVPLAAPVARTALFGWYGENRTARGDWRVAGMTVSPGDLEVPVLAALPRDDRIVPPASAAALADALPAAGLTRISPGAGHIGMVVGSRGRRQLWEPLRDWCGALPDRG